MNADEFGHNNIYLFGDSPRGHPPGRSSGRFQGLQNRRRQRLAFQLQAGLNQVLGPLHVTISPSLQGLAEQPP